MNPNEIRDTHNVNIASISRLSTPRELKDRQPLTKEAWTTILEGRNTIRKILIGEDPRLLVIVGSCSTHNVEETKEYTKSLMEIAHEVKETLYLVQRVNFDKPRSRALSQDGRPSWQGLFNDPKMDNSCDMELGFKLARELLLHIATSGLPIATEMLEKINYQTIDDLLSFVWMGARDCNSQEKKKIASGASTPVGFKNPTEGSADTAIHAIEFARQSHVLAAPNDDGLSCRFATKGNPFGVLIHRGTETGPNYSREAIDQSSHKLRELGLIDRIIVDAAHGNSVDLQSKKKNHFRQKEVILNVATQIIEGNRNVAGIMYESYLKDGRQDIPVDLSDLKAGVSVTDPCDGLERTRETLLELADVYKKSMQ